MPNIHRNIANLFGIKGGDNLPCNGAPWKMDTTRGTIAELMKMMEFKVGAEVGVERGRYSRVLCETIPGVKLYCVDPWVAYGRCSQAREDALYNQTLSRLAGQNVEIMRMTSMEAASKFQDGVLDFVYIDALHDFDHVMVDLILWASKVRSGGIVSGHDYVNYYQYGVVRAVNAYTAEHSITPWYITTEPTEYPSWFFVKP